VAHRCSFVWISSTRASATDGVGHDAPVFTGDLLAFHPERCARSLPPFAMWTAFPSSDYYQGSAPSRGQQPTTCLPATGNTRRRGGQPRDGSHVYH
jgi:hypothetical protein